MSRRRRRRHTGVIEANPIDNQSKSSKKSRFRTVLWIIVGILVFLLITTMTGFYSPDIYMLGIFGIIIIALNIYLLYLSWKG